MSRLLASKPFSLTISYGLFKKEFKFLRFLKIGDMWNSITEDIEISENSLAPR
tara:strand:- start:368 stop:526 length:159 start_codon:yes stop_codon:yes gene_type:complete